MLIFVVNMGADVTKVHQLIKLKQDYIIRDYIDLNTEMRANAKTEPERDTFQQMNNALFGKTCENPLKHIEAKILADDYEILKSVSKLIFKDIFRYRGTALIEFYNKQIKYDKPIYLGATVLELSKLRKYDTFYNVLYPSLKVNHSHKLHYMDTDSCIISYSKGNITDEYMDLSNLDLPIKTNNKTPDKLKYEYGSKINDEVIVLLSKIYSFKYSEQSSSTKEKGINKENRDEHENFYNALMYNKERTVRKMEYKRYVKI